MSRSLGPGYSSRKNEGQGLNVDRLAHVVQMQTSLTPCSMFSKVISHETHHARAHFLTAVVVHQLALTNLLSSKKRLGSLFLSVTLIASNHATRVQWREGFPYFACYLILRCTPDNTQLIERLTGQTEHHYAKEDLNLRITPAPLNQYPCASVECSKQTVLQNIPRKALPARFPHNVIPAPPERAHPFGLRIQPNGLVAFGILH